MSSLSGLCLCLAFVRPVSAASPSTAVESGPAAPAPDEAGELTEPVEENGQSSPSTDDEARVAGLIRRGTMAFETNHFEFAIRLFEEAFAIIPKPNIIFNIGRVYEERGDLVRAIEHYARFIVQPGVDIELRKFAAGRLADLREVVKQAESESDRSAPVAPTPVPTDDASAEPPEVEADLPAVADVFEAQEQPTEGQPLKPSTPPARIAGYALFGVGGAALIAGGVLGAIASSTAEHADQEANVEDENDLRRKARPMAQAADGLFIAGGIVAVAGIVSFAVSFTKKRPQSVAVLPAISRTRVGLDFVRRF